MISKEGALLRRSAGLSLRLPLLLLLWAVLLGWLPRSPQDAPVTEGRLSSFQGQSGDSRL